jgi:hypothetical protein
MPPAQDEVMSELRRPRTGRIIGGVCAAWIVIPAEAATVSAPVPTNTAQTG